MISPVADVMLRFAITCIIKLVQRCIIVHIVILLGFNKKILLYYTTDGNTLIWEM